MSKRAYRAKGVNDVDWDRLAQGKEGLGVTLGLDVGKFSLWAVWRWPDGRFERPWRLARFFVRVAHRPIDRHRGAFACASGL